MIKRKGRGGEKGGLRGEELPTHQKEGSGTASGGQQSMRTEGREKTEEGAALQKKESCTQKKKSHLHNLSQKEMVIERRGGYPSRGGERGKGQVAFKECEWGGKDR